MNEPDKQLKAILQRLDVYLARLAIKVEVYQYLDDCLKDDRIIALNMAPAFFRNVQDALLTDIIVTLDKIYDEQAKRSLFYYLQQMQQSFSSLKFHDDSPFVKGKSEAVFVKLIGEQLDQLRRDQHSLSVIATHRDKYRAHYDSKYFDNPDKLYEDAPLYPDKLADLVKTAQSILREHHRLFFGVDRIMRPVNADDVGFVIKALQRYKKWSNDPEIFNILTRRDDLLND